MNQLNRLHEQAMSLVDQAIIARRHGDNAHVHSLYIHALELETEAAELLRNQLTIEPSRSVLYRSAASIAIRCNRYQEAERLIATGLGGNPPAEIAQELQQLREQIPAEQQAV